MCLSRTMGTKDKIGVRILAIANPDWVYHVTKGSHLDHDAQNGDIERAKQDAIHCQTRSCQCTELLQPADFAVGPDDKDSHFQCVVPQYYIAYPVEGFQNKLSSRLHLAAPFSVFDGHC